MDSPLTRGEHNEFRRTVEAEFEKVNAENNRQNHRIDDIESEVKENRNVILSIHDMQKSIETMCKELTNQGARLKAIEDRESQKWKATVKNIVQIALGLISGLLLAWAKAQLGL